MSLYYVLNKDDYCGVEGQIGDIMMQFGRKLYKETGLSLNLYLGPTTEEINSYFKDQNMEPVLEEVMWQNLNQNEKIERVSGYLREIGAENKKLTIVDPYLFPRKIDDDYKTLLLGVLNSMNFNSIRFITSKNTYNEEFYNYIKNRCNCKNISISFNNDYHDRLWIADKTKGFIMGTSLNGLGKKISLINFIEQEDLIEIVKDLG